MPDLLVRLYDLPAAAPAPKGTVVRRALTAEKQLVVAWASTEFGASWAGECEPAFARLPVSCFSATGQNRLLGFACYDATARGFFGPFGVAKSARRGGLGAGLLHAVLRDMSGNGYGYAIIGAAADSAFYRREVHAIEIPDSEPGFYRGMLKP